MTDRIEKVEKQVTALIAALFQLADDLGKISGPGQEADLVALKHSIESAGGTLRQDLVTINDGRGPTGKIGS